MYMRKLTALILSACLLLSLSACGSKEDNLGDTYLLGTDFQHYFREAFMAESAENYYLFGGDYLYSKSKATGEETVLCNKPDCLHDFEADGTRVSSCNAMFMGPSNIAFYKDKLYILNSITISLTESAQVIYEMDTGGTTRKEIFRAKEFVCAFIVHRGYAYLAFTDFLSSPEEISEGELKTSSYRVDRIDLSRPTKKAETIYEVTGEWGQVNHMFAYGNQLYFVLSKDLGTNILSYNLQDKKTQVMPINQIPLLASPIAIQNNNLIYFENTGAKSTEFLKSYQNQKAVLADLTGNSIGDLAIPCEDLYANKEYIITDNESLVRFDLYTREERAIQIFDKNGKFIKKLMLGNETLPSYGMNEDYYFYLKKNGSDETPYDIWAVDLHKLDDPNLEGEPFFQYTPPVPFPGVVTG